MRNAYRLGSLRNEFYSEQLAQTIDDWRLEAAAVAKDELRARIHDIAKIPRRKRTFRRASRYREIGGVERWVEVRVSAVR